MFYQFDNYVLDKDKRKLFCDSELITDDEKSIKLICLLCENYPEVVDKQVLIESLWPEQVVTDWSLSKLVSDVRQLLGDTGKDQGLIKTIRGKGFRFNSEVSEHTNIEAIAKTSQTKPITKKTGLIAASVITIAIIITGFTLKFSNTEVANSFPLRVAVLPVQGESKDPINEWVKYGVMSMASEQLARYDAIQTLPVSTIISAVAELESEKQRSPSEEQAYYQSVCQQIGCSHVVAIKHKIAASNKAVLSYQIFSADSRSAITEFEQSDVFDAAAMLLDYLVTDLIPGEKQYHSLGDTFSTDQKANRDYAIGVNELIAGDIKAAKDYLNLALNRQPDFFWAKAYLAEAYYRSGDLLLSTQMSDALTASASIRQLSADQNYFLLHLRSNILYAEGKLEESLNTSISLLTNSHAMDDPLLMANELLNIGSSYQATGELDKATNYLEKAKLKYAEANYGPGEGKALYNLANVYLSLLQKPRAIEYYQKAREVFIRFEMPGYALFARHQIASTSISMGEVQFAEAELRQVIESYKKIGDIQGELTAKLDLVEVSLVKGDTKEAMNRVESVIVNIEASEFSYLQNHARRLASVIYLRLGRSKEAEFHYGQFEGKWADIRPSFAFVPAHLKQIKGNFEEALNLAKQVKKSLAENWTPQHQAVLEQFQQSQSNQQIIPIIY